MTFDGELFASMFSASRTIGLGWLDPVRVDVNPTNISTCWDQSVSGENCMVFEYAPRDLMLRHIDSRYKRARAHTTLSQMWWLIREPALFKNLLEIGSGWLDYSDWPDMTFSFVVTTWQWLDNDLTKRYKKTLSSNWTLKKIQQRFFQHGQDLVNHQGMLWACSFGQTLSQRFLDAARGCLVAYGRSLETTAPGGDAKTTRMEEPTDDQRLGWFGKWRIEWWWLDHVPPWNVERKWRMNEHWHSYFIGPQRIDPQITNQTSSMMSPPVWSPFKCQASKILQGSTLAGPNFNKMSLSITSTQVSVDMYM